MLYRLAGRACAREEQIKMTKQIAAKFKRRRLVCAHKVAAYIAQCFTLFWGRGVCPYSWMRWATNAAISYGFDILVHDKEAQCPNR